MEWLALTFDDGPDAEATPALLDLLAAHDARATFFPIAPRAARHPGLIRRMLAEGHTVGVHCTWHERHSHHDVGWGRCDLDASLVALQALGVAPSLWRTPWGDRAEWTTGLAEQRELRLVGWDVDTHDWRGDSAESMFAATRDGLRAGAIVLAHDGIGPGARRVHARDTIAYVARALAHAETCGFAAGAL